MWRLSDDRAPNPFSRGIVVVGLIQGMIFSGLWSWFLASLQGRPVGEVLVPFGLVAGMAFGMALTLTMAWIAQVVSIRVPFEDRVDFLFRLNEATASLGYVPGRRGNSRVVYQPRIRLRGTSPLVVEFEGRVAVIAGPQLQITRLRWQIAK